MNQHEQYRLARYFILGIAFGGILLNWPEDGLNYLSMGTISFYAFVMIFAFLLARWCFRK